MGTALLNRYKVQGVLAALGLGLMLTGCTPEIRTWAPDLTVRTAVKMARYGHPVNVHWFMTGPALDAFGTPEGLVVLRDKLSKVTAIEKPQLIARAEGDQGYGHHGDVKRLFRASVSGRTRQGAPATYTAHVVCSVSYRSFYLPPESEHCVYDGIGSRHYLCQPGAPADYEYREAQTCRLSKLSLEPAGGPELSLLDLKQEYP
jgi:hypothetical protein